MKRQQSGPTAINAICLVWLAPRDWKVLFARTDKSRSGSIQVEEATDRVTTPHASAGAAAAISAG